MNAYLTTLDESVRPDITVGGLAFVDFGKTYYILKCFHHVEGVSRWERAEVVVMSEHT